MIGRQVQDDDERHAVVLGHVLEKLLDGLQTTRRSADSHHREVQVTGAKLSSLWHVGRALAG